MTGLTLVGTVDSYGLEEVSADKWVPFWVKWQSGLLYATYRPPPPFNSVGCEFVLDRYDGRIARFVMVTLPSRVIHPLEDRDGQEVVLGQPVFSREPFEIKENGETRINSVEYLADQYLYIGPKRFGVQLVPAEVVKWVSSDDVRFGIDQTDHLVAIDFPFSMVPEVSDLRRV